jgi:co-chaperonin GroES (HSP10)
MNPSDYKIAQSYVRLRRKPPEKAYAPVQFILLPKEVLNYDSFECEVLDKGPGQLMPNGEIEPLDVEIGDIVVVYQGVEGDCSFEDGSFVVDISACEAKVIRE